MAASGICVLVVDMCWTLVAEEPHRSPILNLEHCPLKTHSGFHLEVELTSRGGDAHPARRARGAVGGAGHIVTTIRHKPLSEFNNIIFKQLTESGQRGLYKGEEGQGNYFPLGLYIYVLYSTAT
jgi:hypothetical protein